MACSIVGLFGMIVSIVQVSGVVFSIVGLSGLVLSIMGLSDMLSLARSSPSWDLRHPFSGMAFSIV